MTQQQDNSDMDGIIDAAMEIAMERADILRQMKEALLADRLQDALLLGCKLTGIQPRDSIRHPVSDGMHV